jgi:prepilin-type N-terminal cleavage/methylation domain-containing protein
MKVRTHACPRRRLRGAERAGFSLIEMSVAAVVLTVAVCGLSGSMVSSLALDRVNHETALAEAAVRGTMERISGTTFDQTFARFNADPSDDPGGAGTSPGATFAVPGLHGVGGALPGSISFPVGAPGELREDVDDARLGMPRDLNGDGSIDSAPHSTNYRILPVRVSVTWRGVRGVRTLTVESMLCAH